MAAADLAGEVLWLLPGARGYSFVPLPAAHVVLSAYHAAGAAGIVQVQMPGEAWVFDWQTMLASVVRPPLVSLPFIVLLAGCYGTQPSAWYLHHGTRLFRLPRDEEVSLNVCVRLQYRFLLFWADSVHGVILADVGTGYVQIFGHRDVNTATLIPV